MFDMWRSSLRHGHSPKVAYVVMLGLEASTLLSTMPPLCTIKAQTTLLFGSIQMSSYSQKPGFLFGCFVLFCFFSWFEVLTSCRSLPPYSANMWHSGWIGVGNPTLEGQAVCVSKLGGLPETARPEAVPSSTPYLPTDIFARLSLPSYLVFPRPYPKGLFPSRGFICPLSVY